MTSSRFQPDKGFSGADGGQSRDGPVQFEKEDEDPFGLNKFLTEAKKAKRPSEESRYEQLKKIVHYVNLFSCRDTGKAKRPKY
jgi:SNW domain-containing protein 1